jgi:hypothetical protein
MVGAVRDSVSGYKAHNGEFKPHYIWLKLGSITCGHYTAVSPIVPCLLRITNYVEPEGNYVAVVIYILGVEATTNGFVTTMRLYST